eukprot:403343397
MQTQNRIIVDQVNQKKVAINHTYQYVCNFRTLSYQSFEQRYLAFTFQVNQQEANSQGQNIKPFGINRLEMSQFLLNGAMGQPHSVNLKILKCPFDVDAFLALQVTVLEQVHLNMIERQSDNTSYMSETSSRVSQMSDLRGSIGGLRESIQSNNGRSEFSQQDSQNDQQKKVLAQSRSEKNIGDIKFNKANVRISNNQKGSPDQNYQKSTSQPTQMIRVSQKGQARMQNEMPQKKIESLIKSLNTNNTGNGSSSGNEEQKIDKDQEIRMMHDQVQYLQKQVYMLKSENEELRGIKQNQDLLISHLKQQNQQYQSSSKPEDIETQQLRNQVKDITEKYQHLLHVLREQNQSLGNNRNVNANGVQRTVSLKQNIYQQSVNTTGEDEEDEIGVISQQFTAPTNQFPTINIQDENDTFQDKLFPGQNGKISNQRGNQNGKVVHDPFSMMKFKSMQYQTSFINDLNPSIGNLQAHQIQNYQYSHNINFNNPSHQNSFNNPGGSPQSTNQNTFDSREEFKSMPFDFTIKDKYNYVKNKLSMVLIDKNQIEQQLINAKMHWATLDLERDNLQIKLKQMNERCDNMASQVQNLQCELTTVRNGSVLGSETGTQEFERYNTMQYNNNHHPNSGGNKETRNSTASITNKNEPIIKKTNKAATKIKNLFKMNKKSKNIDQHQDR